MALYYPETLLPAPPHKVGPTWRQNGDGSWFLPEKTLGWGVLDWLAKYVNSPAGEGPFMPTLEQARFVLWWYAVDETGTYVFQEGVLRRLKGWGKDPFVAALSMVELCGPVSFSHFDEGNPVGKRRHAARIQVAAVSRDQTDNTFSMFPVMMSTQFIKDYGISPHMFVIHADRGGRIEAVTSSPASIEGKRPTFVIQNEIQWWGAEPDGSINNGHTMEKVVRGNVIKVPESRKLSICNAHIPGYDSVGERYYEKWQDIEAGKSVDIGFLYDSLEAPSDTPISEIPSQKEDPDGYAAGIEKLRTGIEIARGDSLWLPIDEILLAVLDTGGSHKDGSTNYTVVESRRMFLNQVNAAEDSWIAPWEWDRCTPDLEKGEEPVAPLRPGERITLGFDGSKSGDHTALCACRVDDGALFLLKTWVPENYPNEEVPREDVDAWVRSTFERYDVVSFRADVKEFEAYVDQWGKDFRTTVKVNASPNNPIAFDMRGQQKKFAFDCERFFDAVQEQALLHDGNRVLRQHVLNAHRHPTNYDAISIRKASKDSSRKIDAAVTAVLAWGARQEFLMSKNNRGRGGLVLR